MKYALDTNIISFILKANPNVYQRFKQAEQSGAICVIPPIAYYEIKRGLLTIKATAKLRVFEKFCRICYVGEMSESVWDIAAEIYAELRSAGKSTDDADIFIAAFCIVNSYTLVTNNTRHFDGISRLRIEDWV